MRAVTRFIAKSCVAFLVAGSVMAGPLTGPIVPTQPIDLTPTIPAMPGMPTAEPIMIHSMLGFMITTPIIAFDNTGTLNYTVADGLLSVDADALAILLNDTDPPSLIFPGGSGANVLINIVVAPDGSLIGGVPGDDLVVTGAVDLNGDFIPDIDGVLLTGEVTQYMGTDSGGTTDMHSYRFNVTGGFLAGPFGSDIAVELTSEQSDFSGNYNVDFSGEAKGDIGVVECIGMIGDFVWLDLDGNGIQDDGEDGIGGVQVILTDAAGNMTTTVTSSNGFYQFNRLCAGTYTVSINPDSLPPDVAVTLINAPGSNDTNDSNDPAGTSVTLPSNDSSDQDTDFGYVPVTSALGDYVWEDLNMDGVQDSNEPPIEGVMVNLYNCEGEFIASDVTDAFGAYFFDNLPSGCYQVEFILPDGFVFTLMDQNGEALDSDPDPTTGFTDPVFLAPGETNPDVDAGMFRPATAELGDRFWEDLNGNGIQDMGEPGIEGVTVNLFDCAGNFIDSTTTDANGMYLFQDLAAGCYVVGFEPPAECVLTAQNVGNDADDSDADPVTGLTTNIDLADSQSDLTWDAGCYYLAGLGDFVWNDLNQDGIQDSGEPGIEGLTVVLLDADMIPTGLTTNTGPNGEYEFTDLAPGSYFVQFTSPAGFVYSPQDAGGNTNDTVDSDANGTGKTDKITLASGEFDPTIDAGVYVPNDPAISIEKSTNGADADVPTGPFVPDGDPVLWEYVVTNTGNVTLTDIFVVDDQGVAVVCPETTLIPGDFMTCTGNGNATVDQYENLGTTCGIDSNGTEVCDDDPSHYFGANPNIDIEKATNGEDADTPTGPYITPGASVTWTYLVENTGNVTLSDVQVTDDQGVTVSCPLTTLVPGQIMTCSADGTAVAGQYANIGSVVGTPPEGAGDPVDDADPSHYFGAAPGIDIEKATNGVDADTPTGPYIGVGSDVTWTYIVTNTGNVPLTNVTVTDNQGVPVSCPTDTLAPAGEPGDSFECTASGTAVAGQYANIGDVVGTPPEGPLVDDEDPSHYFGAAPAIDIEKATNGFDADTPTGPFISTGGAVTWTYVVTNTGNVPLANIMVTDNQGVTVDCSGQNTLAPAGMPGDSFTCIANGIATAGQYANIGSVIGTPPVGGPVTDMDPSHYFGAMPTIDIEKATNGFDADVPTGPFISTGGAVMWAYVVTNTGNVALTNVVVTDSQGVTVDCGGQSTLAPAGTPGDSFTCTASGFAIAGQYMNVGSVCGDDPTGAETCDDDPSHYFGANPSIDIEKATNGFDADDPTGPTIDVGLPVTWTYVVTNTGNVPLVNVIVTDDQGVMVDCGGQSTLAAAGEPGDSFTCTASGIAIEGQYANIGQVCGDDPNGTETCDDDPSHYFGAAETCLILIDEDGIDNGFYNIENAAPACGLYMNNRSAPGMSQDMLGSTRAAARGATQRSADAYLVNDNDWLGMFGYSIDDPLLFPQDVLDDCKSNGLPDEPKLPTECGNPAFLWNLFVRDHSDDYPNCAGPWLLPTGQVDDEGYFALPEKGPTGGIVYQDDRPSYCDRYEYGQGGVDGWDLFVDDFRRGVVPQACLDKVRDVVPLRNQDLVELVGKTCVAIVYDSDINMDYVPQQYANLQGERYGSFTFEIEMVELPALGSAIPESTSDTDFYNLWLKVLPPEIPDAPFAAKRHYHEPDSIQITQATYNNSADRLTVYATSNYAGTDNTAPYLPLDTHPSTFGAPLAMPLIKPAGAPDRWLPAPSSGFPIPDYPGDNYSFMTISVDAFDDAANLGVDPFILEAQMTYNPGQHRYEFVLENVGVNLDGRDVMISTDEGGAYSVRIQ